MNQEKRKAEYNEGELEDAIGDTFMQIVEIANLRGLDIEKVVNKIIEEESPSLE